MIIRGILKEVVLLVIVSSSAVTLVFSVDRLSDMSGKGTSTVQ